MTKPFFGCSFKEERSESMKDDRPNARSDLIAFLYKNQFLFKSRTSAVELTHTLMDGQAGGRICLPDHALDAFMAAYGSDLCRGVKLYVIERRTEVFKMHFDLDFNVIHGEALCEDIVETIRQAVASFLAPHSGKDAWCITCAVLDDARQARKSAGLHLVFPWLLVNSEQALWLRATAVSKLRRRHADVETNWDTVVDIAVLTTNGLRMVGSDKCRDCSHCHNGKDARNFCPMCSRQGKIADNKVYWPWKTHPQPITAGLCADLRANPAYAARMCSTRVPLARQKINAHFVIPCGAPPPSVRKKLKLVDAKEKGREHLLQDAEPASLRLRTESLELTSQLRAALADTLLQHHSAYGALEVVSLERLVGLRHLDSYCVKVRGFGCRFCQNKQVEHTQQSVYFMINRRGLMQRCYSRKHIERTSGLCSNYASPPTALSSSLQTLLYEKDARCDSQDVQIAEPPTRRMKGLDLAERLWGMVDAGKQGRE